MNLDGLHLALGFATLLVTIWAIWLKVHYRRVDATEARLNDFADKIEANFTRLISKVETLQADVVKIRADIKTLQADVVEIRADVKTLQADVVEIGADVKTLRANEAKIQAGTQALSRDLSASSLRGRKYWGRGPNAWASGCENL